MRPKGSPAELEARRIRAVRLVKRGRSINAAAREVSASPSSVKRWIDAHGEGGRKALRPARQGAGRRLTPAQARRLKRVICGGAAKAGFRTDYWTLSRIATVIEREFGVRYHRGHIPRVLKALDLQSDVDRSNEFAQYVENFKL